MGDKNITKMLEQILKNQTKQSIQHLPPLPPMHIPINYPLPTQTAQIPLHVLPPMDFKTNTEISTVINPKPFTCDLVIARYKEKLDWLSKYNKYKFRNVILYNKYEKDNEKSSKDIGCVLNSKECIKINLKNEGRCDHTYLYHIIENYNDLADVTIFTKGSSDLFRESVKLEYTIAKVFEMQDTVISADNIPLPVHIFLANFSLENYKSSHPINYNDDTNSTKMKPASIRPFGEWFKAKFPGIETYKIVYAAVFALSKKQIHQQPKSYYQNLIKELEGHPNPEVGHYFERSWMAIFHPIPESCIYPSVAHSYHFGGRRTRRKGKNLKRKRVLRRKKTKRSRLSRLSRLSRRYVK